jgi:hypothetical protein
MSSTHDDHSYLSAPSPNPSNNGSNETFIDPSPIAPSSNGTEFADLDEVAEHQNDKAAGGTNLAQSQNNTTQQPDLKVGRDNRVIGVCDS